MIFLREMDLGEFFVITSYSIHYTKLYDLGWMPAARCAELQQRLEARFAGRVTLESLKILERDLERVPVALMNPPYFRAYERLTKLLPLPRYTSS